MKFTYQMTVRELSKALTLMGTPVVGAWLVYLVVAVAMFPSIVLFAALGAEISFGWFSLMAIGILVAAAWAYVKRTGYPQPFRESMEFTADQLTYMFGHSQVDCNWSVIEKVDVDQEFLSIYSYGRPWQLPKRALGDRVPECLEFLKQVTTVEKRDSVPASMRLYQDQLLESTARGYRYQVTSEDLSQAVREKFQPVSLGTLSLPGRAKSKPASLVQWLLVLLFVFFSVQVIYFAGGAGYFFRSTTTARLALTLAGWLLPAVKQKIPKLESILKLGSEGWVIANPLGGTRGDWRDLQALLQSQNFIAFKMINQLAYLIPKRIFASPEEINEVVVQALQYCQNCKLAALASDRNAEVMLARETHNPYQSPTGS